MIVFWRPAGRTRFQHQAGAIFRPDGHLLARCQRRGAAAHLHARTHHVPHEQLGRWRRADARSTRQRQRKWRCRIACTDWQRHSAVLYAAARLEGHIPPTPSFPAPHARSVLHFRPRALALCRVARRVACFAPRLHQGCCKSNPCSLLCHTPLPTWPPSRIMAAGLRRLGRPTLHGQRRPT